jgi:hypothetical protein
MLNVFQHSIYLYSYVVSYDKNLLVANQTSRCIVWPMVQLHKRMVHTLLCITVKAVTQISNVIRHHVSVQNRRYAFWPK